MGLPIDMLQEFVIIAEREKVAAREAVRTANARYRNAVHGLASIQKALRETKRLCKSPQPSADAKRRGDKYYIGTKPCKRCGLIGKRYTSTRKCVKCNPILCREHYHKTKLRKKYALPEFNIGT